MGFFTVQTQTFLANLEQNNNREWFGENKNRFKQEVQQPFQDFVANAIVALQAFYPSLHAEVKNCMFRIYRDVRFSKDKTPYKTHISAAISKFGKKVAHLPSVYFQLNKDELRMYSGVYGLNSKQCELMRNAIYYDLDLFNDLANNPNFKRVFGEILGEKYKRLPEPYKNIAQQQPLIANKAFYYFKSYDWQVAQQNNLVEILMNDYTAAIPFNNFLEEVLA